MNILKRLLGRDMDELIEETLDPDNSDQYSYETLLNRKEEKGEKD